MIGSFVHELTSFAPVYKEAYTYLNKQNFSVSIMKIGRVYCCKIFNQRKKCASRWDSEDLQEAFKLSLNVLVYTKIHGVSREKIREFIKLMNNESMLMNVMEK